MTEFRVNDVELQDFLYSFTDGDGKLPSDFEQLKREGHYLIHGDAERSFCLKERSLFKRYYGEPAGEVNLFFLQHARILYTRQQRSIWGSEKSVRVASKKGILA